GLEWGPAALKTAKFVGKGPYISRKVREWSRAYISDHGNLPFIRYGGAWTKSHIRDEDLQEELLLHLQSLGKYVTASAIIIYLDHLEVQARYGLTKTISLATAQHWMTEVGYRWGKDPKGQYIDGHERDDVVFYRQNSFIPAWYKIDANTRRWSSANPLQCKNDETDVGRKTVVWFHDESTFYAHDRRKTYWVPKDAKALPQQKGEGSSLMVADFISADYGWLRSHDGKESARVLFRAGKGRDGYFTNDEILAQVKKAMGILEKDYPDEDHIFVFDNATTHLKRADDALSAHYMPKSCRQWGKIPMMDGTFADGSLHEFYYLPGHTKAGFFKGMATILEEHGFDVSNLKAQCHNSKPFDCVAGTAACCCQRILYNEPDFINVKSLLEQTCEDRGFQVLFLPKFHCKLNFIEQCWGYAKWLYHCYPPSSKETDLECNVINALDAVPLATMRKFAIRCHRFVDAYHKGLNGAQAAWAVKKYRGHRVLPDTLMTDLDDAKAKANGEGLR
ncbi:hypothetical protein PAXRUDRAFT_789771, partial [Paxillus rubicundulus Ve08.2h10]